VSLTPLITLFENYNIGLKSFRKEDETIN